MNLGWVIRMFMAAGVTVCHAAVAATQDEVIPPAVAGPYLAYEQAVAAQDAAAARAAALQAFAAAQETGLSDTIMLRLGVNAVAAAEQARDWSGIPEVAMTAAEAAKRLGDTDEERELRFIALSAARLSGDYVAMLPASRSLFRHFFEAGAAPGVELGRLGLLSARPRIALDEATRAARVQAAATALALGASGARDYVNAQMALQQHAIAVGEWHMALSVTVEAALALQTIGQTRPELLDAVFASVSEILWNGYRDAGDGQARLAAAAGLWCDWLASQPQFSVMREPLYPTEAVAQGHDSNLVMARFRVPASGGGAQVIESTAVVSRSAGRFRRSVAAALANARFRPQCNPESPDAEAIIWAGFAVTGRRGHRGATLVEARVAVGF